MQIAPLSCWENDQRAFGGESIGKKLALLLPLLLVAGCDGCRQRAANSGGGGNSQWQQSDPKWQEELLTYAVDNLNQMEKYQTQETFFGIVRQIYSLQQAAADKDAKQRLDPLSAAWPETEIFNQVLDRLNQWLRVQPPPGDWKPDSLVETLTDTLKELPDVKDLGRMEFSAYDGYCLMEAAYFRDAALWARGDALDDLARAKNLFSWTIRNIQLEMDSPRRVPLFPWESLLFGAARSWNGPGFSSSWRGSKVLTRPFWPWLISQKTRLRPGKAGP